MSKKHEQFAYRLSHILKQLNSGTRLDVQQLANEFDITPRTVQRDLNERLGFLEWNERGPRYYSLDKAKIGHLLPEDIERFAREAYVSMARMSGAIGNLESIGARANAQQVAQMMKKGIEHINFATVTQPGQTLQVGRELLKVVDQIAQAPQKYMQFVDPHKLGTPKAGPWDFEPVHRSRSDNSLSF